MALAGNPNVGKSSLFNALTGLRHHTGNWSGKTVEASAGYRRKGNTLYEFVDLPGTYSLPGFSQDEQVAADFIAQGRADCIVVVCDGSALERNLILALQIIEQCRRVVLCINLMDEARRQGISIDTCGLEAELGVPVVLTAVPRHQGLPQLLQAIDRVLAGERQPSRRFLSPLLAAQALCADHVHQEALGQEQWRLTLDKILVSRRYGVPILLALVFLILSITVWGANYPSQALQTLFDKGCELLSMALATWPQWLRGLLLEGMYTTTARVLAVMLPPMAIFFPLFTLLEDVGYLPRMAFLLDGKMRRCGGCGKQALTLCMGLGCNAVGVTGCRIIDSPRERLAAILTNSFIPCNGRFPTLIFLASLLLPSGGGLVVTGAVLLSLLVTMVTTGLLSKTILKHKPSVFLLELPPLRRPRIGEILVRSLLDRTLRVALRALVVAAPAGGILWLLETEGILPGILGFLEPFGSLLGLNGAILLGFLLSLPANELLLPSIALAAGSLELSPSLALCTLVFTLFHWPCSTTLLTIYKETGSLKQTAAAFFLPTAVGVGLCMLLNGLLYLIGG